MTTKTITTPKLLEKLRRKREVQTWYTGGYRNIEFVNPDGPEAADEIEKLQKEVENWKRAANRNHAMASKYGGEDW